MQTFDELFRLATGYTPHGYQRRIARDGLPDVVEAPTGTGKTGIILAWLWRRFHSPETTPRRLIYALPQRSLVDQTAGEVGKWLARIDACEVALHVVMGGGSKESQRDWRQNMHEPAIVIGTVDSLVSKALNRGYGIGRAIFPVDFALVTNGAHWIIDEIQLCPESTTTLRQLAGFTAKYPTAEPFGLTCMSATIPERLLGTVDNPDVSRKIVIEPGERTGELKTRLDANRTIRKLDASPGDYEAIARQAGELHRPGELTLVVLNTVDAARAVHKQLGTDTKTTLLHSRFRPVERERLMKEVTESPDDRIVVSTQVIEAGIDLNAATMITESAPWASLVQRAGRCNRSGKIADAALWWVPPSTKAGPYPQADIDATSSELARLEGQAVTSEDLIARNVEVTRPQVAVIRRPDFIELFDTSSDLSGNDIDIAPYIRDADDLDAQLAWATWTPDDKKEIRPPAEGRTPTAEYRCRVPLGKVNELAKSIPVWRLGQVAGGWTRVNVGARARPGEVLVVNAADGRYDPITGFDPAAREPVPDSPELMTKINPADGTEDPYKADSTNVRQGNWITLWQHSEDVRDEAARLVETIQPDLPATAIESAIAAAYLHDAGKAHEIWQSALRVLAPEEDTAHRDAQEPWAKSSINGRLEFAGGVAFRHELASLLLLDGPLNYLLADVPDPDLARYLVLSHHGKLRVQVREPGDESGTQIILGLEHGVTTALPAMFGRPSAELVIDLDQFRFGGDRSWTRTALALRDRYGPFVLAYLEAIVRVADWRASEAESK